jgi:hypothetical protein
MSESGALRGTQRKAHMDAFKPRGRKGPEKKIQEAIERMLTLKGWHVMRTHGNMFQSGFPDNFACHRKYGQRWVEVKDPKRTGTPFTPAQMDQFPLMCANGSGVWVLVAATDNEYEKLFKPPNWYSYIRSVW